MTTTAVLFEPSYSGPVAATLGDSRRANLPEVIVLHTEKDRTFAVALATHAEGLRRSGRAQLSLYSESKESSDARPDLQIRDRVNRAALVVVLLSPHFIKSETMRLAEQALLLGASIVPVLARVCAWKRTELRRLVPLPRSGGAIDQYPFPDEAYAEVVVDLRESLGRLSGAAHSAERPLDRRKSTVRRKGFSVNQLFSEDTRLDAGYVEPAEYDQLRNALTRPDDALVLEGPAGSGKSAAVKRALKSLALDFVHLSPGDQRLDSLHRPEDVDGWIVIDHFHRLDETRKRRIADLMQLMSDNRRKRGKLILVGVGQLARAILTLNPQLALRFELISMRRQSDTIIDKLLRSWERALNIHFEPRDALMLLAKGSFALARQLAVHAITDARITETQTSPIGVAVSRATLVDRLLKELKFAYDDIFNLVRADAKMVPRGVYLALLWLLSERGDKRLPISELSNRYPQFLRVAETIGYDRLLAPVRESATLSQSVWVDRESVTAADPKLSFYLQHTSFAELINAAGLRGVARINGNGVLKYRVASGNANRFDAIGFAMWDISDGDLFWGREDVRALLPLLSSACETDYREFLQVALQAGISPGTIAHIGRAALDIAHEVLDRARQLGVVKTFLETLRANERFAGYGLDLGRFLTWPPPTNGGKRRSAKGRP